MTLFSWHAFSRNYGSRLSFFENATKDRLLNQLNFESPIQAYREK